jgi:hypothetical protein
MKILRLRSAIVMDSTELFYIQMPRLMDRRLLKKTSDRNAFMKNRIRMTETCSGTMSRLYIKIATGISTLTALNQPIPS